MSLKIPRLRIFAGPNGSGKSTIKEVISKELLGIYINPDEIEKHRSDFGIDDSSLIYHKLNGANITALFPIFQTSPITLITQENFSTIDSLQNKNIEFSSNELVNISIKAILKSNNINI